MVLSMIIVRMCFTYIRNYKPEHVPKLTAAANTPSAPQIIGCLSSGYGPGAWTTILNDQYFSVSIVGIFNASVP